ncbi:MAG TPA: hypothetical protein VGI28_13505 [Stellaceae bacterium]
MQSQPAISLSVGGTDVHQSPWAALPAQPATITDPRKTKLSRGRVAVLVGMVLTSVLLWWALVRATLAAIALIH